MTINQTIYGVSRELIEHAIEALTRHLDQHAPMQVPPSKADSDLVREELRALLDKEVGGDSRAPQAQGEPVACAHDWLDDGEYLIVCTKCGAQENYDPCWRDMASAPTDGTMVRLLVEFEEHSTEDADQAATIGANNFENDDEDVWRFAGWCWSHDHFTEGKGIPVGWLPMLDGAKLSPGAGQPAPVAVVPELTSELRWILGQMCFQHIHTAQALRLMGHQIARKAEDEQAVTIYWMLGHYLKDPENWRDNATAELKASAPAA